MTRIAFANVTELALKDAFTNLVEDPPWPWLENANGVVAWMNDADALSFAKDEFKTLFGSTPNVVNRVVDRAFVANLARQRAIDPGISELVREAGASTSGVESVVATWPAWAQAKFAYFVARGHADFFVVGRSGVFRFTNPEGLVPWNQNRGNDFGGVVEPMPERIREFASAWFVDGHGEPHLLGLVERSDVDFRFELGPYGFFANFGHDEEAIERARVVVEAAAKLEYRGVCAVDGYTFRTDAFDSSATLRAVAAFRPRFTAVHVALGLAARERANVGARFRFVVDDAKLEIAS